MRELKNIQGGRSQKTLDRYFYAVKSKDNIRLEDLILNHKIDVNVSDYSGKTALFHAINTHNVSAVMLLIKQSCDVNKASYVAYHRDNQLLSCVEPPLITAVRVGCHEVIHLLLAFGAKVDHETEIRKRDDLLFKDKTALSFAVEDNKVEDVISLLQHHAEVNREDSTGELPIHKAVRCRDCEKQSQILRHLCEHGSDINHVNKIDCSPLYLATFYGCFNKVQTLLLYDADINRTCTRENSYGSALHIAAAKDKEDIANVLLLFGANMDISNAMGYTPLQLNIKSHGQSVVAKLLIQHGAALDSLTQRGFTLMATIIKNMRLDCENLAKLLVHAGYDLRRDQWLKPPEFQDNSMYPETPRSKIPIPHGRVETLCNWLRDKQQNADCLANICRISIRSSLRIKSNGCSILESVFILPIPTSLKSFILLSDWMY